MNAPNKPNTFAVGGGRPEPQTSVGRLAARPAKDAPIGFLVLLLPGFSQLCLSSLIDPLRLANSLSGSTLFHWDVVSLDGGSVESASGISVNVSGSFDESRKSLLIDQRRTLMIFAGDDVEHHNTHDLRSLLRRCVRSCIPVYALGTATWLLAGAGVLSEARCTIHWGKMAALAETFYDLAIDDALFVSITMELGPRIFA